MRVRACAHTHTFCQICWIEVCMRNILILTLQLVIFEWLNFGGWDRQKDMYVRSMQFWSENLVWRGFRCRQKWEDNIKRWRWSCPWPCHEYRASRGTAPLIINLGTRWNGDQLSHSDCFMPRTKPNYLLNRRMSCTMHSIYFWREKSLGSVRIQSLACAARILVIILPALYRLPIKKDL